jgi:hypothetical protein
MTAKDLATEALPYVRTALIGAKPAIVQEIGRAGMFILSPAWAMITGPLCPLLTRIAIELAIGLAAPRGLPVFAVLGTMAKTLPDGYMPAAHRVWLAGVVALLETPRAAMHESVQSALNARP